MRVTRELNCCTDPERNTRSDKKIVFTYQRAKENQPSSCENDLMPPPPQSAGSLLCESCGYALGGLDTGGTCPECGRSIEQSLPDRRPGSPWQQRQGVVGWLRTFGTLIHHPRTSWDRFSIEPVSAARLLFLNWAVSASAATTLLIGGPVYPSPYAGYVIAFFVVTLFGFAALTSVEFTGIRFFGSRRGFRITRATGLVIVAHASYGWLVSGFGATIAGHIARRVPALWDGVPSRGLGIDDIAIFAAIVSAPVILGMIIFSLLAGAGFHAMRYANSPRPAE